MTDETKDWLDGVDRAVEDHGLSREPYASMDRDEILALMHEDGLKGYEYELLRQHFLDKLSITELERDNFTSELALWLLERSNASGNAQCQFCNQVAIEATNRIF